MMASALRKGLVYFGLADDGLQEVGAAPQAKTPLEYAPVALPSAAPTHVEHDDWAAEVTPIRANQAYAPVAPSSEFRRITTIHPRSYNDARLIGEAFRAGTPVIINLSDMSDDDAKRLVDFSSGLIFGLNGTLERVTARVFLLSPEHIEVIGEEDFGGEVIHGQFYNQS
jgi:cell division inhibitor SepF